MTGYHFKLTGYTQVCNCCGHTYTGPAGARAYIEHIRGMTYYAARIAPEVTWGLTAQAREYLRLPITFEEWCKNYRPRSVEALGFIFGISFEGHPKAPAYQAWREAHHVVRVS